MSKCVRTNVAFKLKVAVDELGLVIINANKIAI